MLDISKQLLSMNFINQEQLDNFVFNYGFNNFIDQGTCFADR